MVQWTVQRIQPIMTKISCTLFSYFPIIIQFLKYHSEKVRLQYDIMNSETSQRLYYLQTVSLARRSGSSRPRGGLVISKSQHRIRERNKCWIPSIHCTMIFIEHQQTPQLWNFKKRLLNSRRWITLVSRFYQSCLAKKNSLVDHFQILWSTPDVQKFTLSKLSN